MTISHNELKQFGTSFAAMLLTGIFICLWSLLLFIPGIIAAFLLGDTLIELFFFVPSV